MNKLAIVAFAAAALAAAPALAQYAPAPRPYSGAYGAAPGPFFGQASRSFYGRVYSRERDIATARDPNVRLQLRREQNLNPGIYNR